MDIIERRKLVRRLDCPFVFHRNGKPIKSFRRAFKAACKGRRPRRTAAARHAAVGGQELPQGWAIEHERMKLSGHQTDSVYRRHDIISDDDLTAAMEKVREHLRKEFENRKVVTIKRETA